MVCLGLEPLESTELWLHLHFKLDLVVVDFKRKRELKRTFDQFKCPLICSSCSQSTLLFWISDRISVLHRFTYLHVYNNMNKAFKSSDYSEEACRNSSRRSRSNEGETISAKLGDCHSGEWEGLPFVSDKIRTWRNWISLPDDSKVRSSICKFVPGFDTGTSWTSVPR